MHRFLVSSLDLRGGSLRVSGEPAQQIRRVLRMRTGDQLLVFDGRGSEFVMRIVAFGKDEVVLAPESEVENATEPSVRVRLFLSILNKAEKFEWILQKGTEVGAAAFVPIFAERSVSMSANAVRRERWERIIVEAVEQSGRARVPVLEEPRTFSEALTSLRDSLSIMPEVGAALSMRAALALAQPTLDWVNIFVGPEGGFTTSEKTAAQSAGVLIASLGPRILRSETAALAALTATLFALGDMDRSILALVPPVEKGGKLD